MSNFTLHHAQHFDADGHPASESVCYSYSNTEQFEKLTTASRCYEVIANKISTDTDAEFSINFVGRGLKARFSNNRWPSILISVDGQSLTLSKLPMNELEALLLCLQDI